MNMAELWENDDPAQLRANVRKLVAELATVRRERDDARKALEVVCAERFANPRTEYDARLAEAHRILQVQEDQELLAAHEADLAEQDALAASGHSERESLDDVLSKAEAEARDEEARGGGPDE